MRPIDADALIIKVRDLVEEYERRMPYWSMNDMLTSGRDAAAKWGYKVDGVEDVLKLIIDAPIIKAESIKHGRWMGTVCTACGESDSLYFNHDFCPNCGARMDGGEEDEEQQDQEGGV